MPLITKSPSLSNLHAINALNTIKPNLLPRSKSLNNLATHLNTTAATSFSYNNTEDIIPSIATNQETPVIHQEIQAVAHTSEATPEHISIIRFDFNQIADTQQRAELQALHAAKMHEISQPPSSNRAQLLKQLQGAINNKNNTQAYQVLQQLCPSNVLHELSPSIQENTSFLGNLMFSLKNLTLGNSDENTIISSLSSNNLKHTIETYNLHKIILQHNVLDVLLAISKQEQATNDDKEQIIESALGHNYLQQLPPIVSGISYKEIINKLQKLDDWKNFIHMQKSNTRKALEAGGAAKDFVLNRWEDWKNLDGYQQYNTIMALKAGGAAKDFVLNRWEDWKNMPSGQQSITIEALNTGGAFKDFVLNRWEDWKNLDSNQQKIIIVVIKVAGTAFLDKNWEDLKNFDVEQQFNTIEALNIRGTAKYFILNHFDDWKNMDAAQQRELLYFLQEQNHTDVLDNIAQYVTFTREKIQALKNLHNHAEKSIQNLAKNHSNALRGHHEYYLQFLTTALEDGFAAPVILANPTEILSLNIEQIQRRFPHIEVMVNIDDVHTQEVENQTKINTDYVLGKNPLNAADIKAQLKIIHTKITHDIKNLPNTNMRSLVSIDKDIQSIKQQIAAINTHNANCALPEKQNTTNLEAQLKTLKQELEPVLNKFKLECAEAFLNSDVMQETIDSDGVNTLNNMITSLFTLAHSKAHSKADSTEINWLNPENVKNPQQLQQQIYALLVDKLYESQRAYVISDSGVEDYSVKLGQESRLSCYAGARNRVALVASAFINFDPPLPQQNNYEKEFFTSINNVLNNVKPNHANFAALKTLFKDMKKDEDVAGGAYVANKEIWANIQDLVRTELKNAHPALHKEENKALEEKLWATASTEENLENILPYAIIKDAIVAKFKD
jgi:hypothetical protein